MINYTFFDKYFNLVFITVKKIFPDPRETRDTTFEVFSEKLLKAIESNEKFSDALKAEDENAIARLIQKTTFNYCIDKKRKIKRTATLQLPDDQHLVNLGVAPGFVEDLDLPYYLSLLNEKERMVLEFYMSGYTHEEIAEKMNISNVNSRKLLSRARDKMRGYLKTEKNFR